MSKNLERDQIEQLQEIIENLKLISRYYSNSKGVNAGIIEWNLKRSVEQIEHAASLAEILVLVGGNNE